jgi:hypothetical protein
MMEDRTQQATDRLIAWIDDANLPDWVEGELRESLEYMMILHRDKMARKAQQRKG